MSSFMGIISLRHTLLDCPSVISKSCKGIFFNVYVFQSLERIISNLNRALSLNPSKLFLTETNLKMYFMLQLRHLAQPQWQLTIRPFSLSGGYKKWLLIAIKMILNLSITWFRHLRLFSIISKDTVQGWGQKAGNTQNQPPQEHCNCTCQDKSRIFTA